MKRQTAGESLRIVLLEPAHPGNVAELARAIDITGVGRLWLVRPRIAIDRTNLQLLDDSPSRTALSQMHVAQSWEEAVEGCGLVIATGERSETGEVECPDFRTGMDTLVRSLGDQEAAIVFGRERRGMTRTETARCDFILNIPASSEHLSYTLANSVLIILYEVMMKLR